ncbi:MAG: ferredoxin [Candidatus Melainabacteria bacterium GWF2_32_7]|nr:MAG: ferredoxin [Candidatus Melainabacteria bacterium GWF2_32_7]
MEKIKLIINGHEIEALKGSTILEAAKSAGINIPTLCYLANVSVSGACRMCVVEVDGARNLVPSCAYPIAEGMKIETHSPRVVQARKIILELLIANHPKDCLKCDKSGNCQLQSLAEEYEIRDIPFTGKVRTNLPDLASPSIERDPDKCILCGKCVKVCEEIQAVNAIDFSRRGFDTIVTPAFNRSMHEAVCVNCGQCIMVCPTGALREKSNINVVKEALNDPEKYVVVQTAPAIRVTIGEAMGMDPGAISTGRMVTSLKRLGFDKVFDTDLAADLTIMEEGSELVHRITNSGVLPMMTSCSPGWIKFIEHFYPSLIPNLSSCKSPHQMLGATIKSYYAKKQGLDPKSIYVVSIMPCTAKKFESQRSEMEVEGFADVDAVLTTRELVKMLKSSGIDFSSLEEAEFDNPLGTASGAGDIFASSGGVMEAALRSAYFLITGEELENIDFHAVRGVEGMKEATIPVKGMDVKIAVINSLGQARKLMDKIEKGEVDYHFIEVMTCPGGCIAGGGQPLNTDIERIKARLKSIYAIDANKKLRLSHHNPDVQQLYKEFFQKPLSEVSHKYLHTHYKERSGV